MKSSEIPRFQSRLGQFGPALSVVAKNV